MAAELRSYLLNGGTALALPRDPRIEDDALAGLESLAAADRERITSVVLSRTGIRGPGLTYLGCLPRLRCLYLNATPIDDSAPLSHLPPSLEGINLDDTEVGDDIIRGLCRMPKLAWVCIRRTRVTDHGLYLLGRSIMLRECSCEGALISPTARVRIANAMAMNASTFLSSTRSLAAAVATELMRLRALVAE